MNDFATFGEMLLTGITEVNARLEEMQSEVRFTENVELGEEVYDVFMAKKKSGKPKDEEPNWELTQKVKEAGVADNLFTVYYTSKAIVSATEATQSAAFQGQPESEPQANPLVKQAEEVAAPTQVQAEPVVEQLRATESTDFRQEPREDSIAPSTLIEATN